MPIHKTMLAALSLLSYPDLDIERTYLVERKLQKLTARRARKPWLYRIWEHSIPSGEHHIPMRIFTPTQRKRNCVLLFFHGGGWVTGSIDSYDGICGDMAAQTGCVVASVDYRLAPEHRFPAAVEDCYAAAWEVFLHSDLLGAPPENVVLIGDSAGGNLAAAVSLMARDRGEFLPTGQLLIYPAVGNDHSENSPFPSGRENGTGYLLTAKRVRDFFSLYRECESDLENPYFAPLAAKTFANQPNTLIITAEFCPLRDEGEAYGERLREAGNHVEIHRIPDALHGYFSLPVWFKQVKKTYAIINSFLEENYER